VVERSKTSGLLVVFFTEAALVNEQTATPQFVDAATFVISPCRQNKDQATSLIPLPDNWPQKLS